MQLRRADELEKQALQASKDAADVEKSGNKSSANYYKRRSVELFSEAEIFRNAAVAKQKALTTPRQRITAWSGKELLVLVTTDDMSEFIAKIGPHGFCQWRGRFIESDGKIATYEVSWIDRIDAPTGFPPSPELTPAQSSGGFGGPTQ